jgi:hypothetical protein
LKRDRWKPRPIVERIRIRMLLGRRVKEVKRRRPRRVRRSLL